MMFYVCFLYLLDDGQSWEKYFIKLLDKFILIYVFFSVKVDFVEMERIFSECFVVVVIFIMNLVECLLELNSFVFDKINSY